MITIQQQVIVEAGGRIAFQSSELREGESVVVTVSAEREDMTVQDRLAAWKKLRRQMNLSPEAADKWLAEIRAERDAR